MPHEVRERKMALVSLREVSIAFGGPAILDSVSLSIEKGERSCVTGRNGEGKSTLLKILAGIDTELMGTVQVAKGTKVGYLPQEPELDDSKTVLETVMEGVAEAQAMITRYEDLCCELDDPKAAAEMEKLQEIIDRNDYWNLENLVERRMADLCCPPGDKQVAVLSGGERRRVALCRLLLEAPDLLLLDLMMPGIDGFEVIRRLRSSDDTKDLPIIILSALNSEQDISKGFQLGANDFINKPIIMEKLINSVTTQINLQEAKRKLQG